MQFLSDEFLTEILSVKFGGKIVRIRRVRIDDDDDDGGASKNQGYNSKMYNVFVKIDCDANTKIVYLLAKVPLPRCDRPMHHQLGFYTNEMFAYDHILPRVNALLDEPLTPDHYHTTEDGILLLENLCKSGYQIRDKHDFLDYQSCVVCFETLAKIHAVSYKVMAQDEFLRNGFNNVTSMSPSCRTLIRDGFMPLAKSILRSEKASETKLREFDAIWQRIPNEVLDEINSADMRFRTWCHGDLTHENMLFKYDRDGKTEKVKFVDFQLIRWCSPVWDIIYLTLTSIKFDTFAAHFDEFLDVYANKLNETFVKCGVDFKYDKSDIRKDFERVPMSTLSCYGGIMIHMGYAETVDEVFKTNKVAEDRENDNPLLREAIPKWFAYLSENNWHF